MVSVSSLRCVVTRIEVLYLILVQEDESDLPVLRTIHTETMGKDAVMVYVIDPSTS